MDDSQIVEAAITGVKIGSMSLEDGIKYLEDRDIYIGRGTKRRLLQASATFILKADHNFYAAT